MTTPDATPLSLPRFSVALISSAALGYEILLMRLFSIIQWHHFAYMIISLALLGYGASGTFLALGRAWLLRNFSAAYLCNLILFGFSSVICFLAAQRIPFNPEEVLWDIRQPFQLVFIYLILALPFFFAANAVGLALTRYRENVSAVYAADLLGAGAGSLAVVALLYLLLPAGALLVLGTLGGLAAAVAWWELGHRPRALVLGLALFSLWPFTLPDGLMELKISPYKSLSQTLRVTGTRIMAERSSPLGWIAVVESPVIPLRHAPGVSLGTTVEPPEQVGVFTDGDGLSAITRFRGDKKSLAYLGEMTSALPYRLRSPNHVLVLGAGGGSFVLQARYLGAGRIDAVELNPQIVELVRKEFSEFSGGLYETEGVTVHVGEARGFVSTHRDRYDLIQVPPLDSFLATTAGLYALSESYLYTVEALQEFLEHLEPGGYLAFTRWIRLPPRETLKLFGTAVEALKRSGVSAPGQSLVLIRGLQTSTLLVKNGGFTAGEIAGIRDFCEQWSFDPAWFPGMIESEANRSNQLDAPYFFQGARALLSEERDAFLERYKFDLRPATDDRPFFFQFFKWRALPEVLSLRGRGGMAFLETGYLVLTATLAQAFAASLGLILLPLVFFRRGPGKWPAGTRPGRAFLYFFLIGMAFLFIEMAFIQKFILFLHHPLFAAAVVLSGFLIFAGLGSYYSKRRGEARGLRSSAGVAVGWIAGLGLIYLPVLDPLFKLLTGVPVPFKILISLLLIAPLAFRMGMPFPLGLARLGATSPALVPWVWGVNGCASVISAVLAAILAIHFGFTTVILLALGLYGIAARSFP